MRYTNEDGKLHRVHGPALEWNGGDYSWYYNGQYHRYYGPARRWNGDNEYWIFDKGVK